MTIFEMEQALAVNTKPDKKPTVVSQVLASLNFVRMCGPIVEVVGEKLQFVHFTVAEYVLNILISTSGVRE